MKIPGSLKFTGKDPSIVGKGKSEILRALALKFRLQKDFNERAKQDFHGKAPSVFVGSHGYPFVNTGFLSSEEYADNDNPLKWSREGSSKFDILKIIGLRSSLVNSRFKVSVKDAARFSDRLRDVSISAKPVDAEVSLEKKPYFNVSLDRDLLPHGPAVPLKLFRVTENPKVPRAVEKAESDHDLRAGEAVTGLFGKGIDEHYLSRVFSAGNLGLKSERKIVPTKWSITAVDDIIGKKQSLSLIRDFKEHEYACFFGGYLGNYYLAIIIPGPWSYELFETYVGAGLSNPSIFESASDFEGVFGRKSYASNTVGGYYAARLAALEYFGRVKRRGKVLLLRFITDEYWAPLGVWVVREAARKAFSSRKVVFGSFSEIVSYARDLCLARFNLDVNVLFGRSLLLKYDWEQKTLSNY